MTNVLHLKLTAGNDTYVTKNATGADLWAGFDVYFVGGMPTVDGQISGYVAAFAKSGGESDGLFVTQVSGADKWRTDYDSDGPFATVATGSWIHVDFRFKPGTPIASELWIDGVDQAIDVTGVNNANAITGVAYGAWFPGGWETAYELYVANPSIGTTKGGNEVWSSSLSGGLGDFDDVVTGAGATLEVIADPTGTVPDGPGDTSTGADGGGGTDVGDPHGGVLVAVAYDADAFDAAPEWTSLAGVQSVKIDRGRQYELDRTSTGTATITLVDTTGDYDPTNAGADPGAGDPMKQIKIELVHPVTEENWMLFRGFVSNWWVEPHVTENWNIVTIECADALDLFAAAELTATDPLTYGDTVPVGSDGDVFYEETNELDAVQTRIRQVLTELGWPSALTSIFTGNVALQEVVYAARTPALTVMQDAADAEFPTVSNLYVSKTGKVTFHGRFSRFDPTNTQYHINDWNVGDKAAADASPSTVVPVSVPFGFGKDKENLFTAALAVPKDMNDEDIEGQYLVDSVAAGNIGLRTWSAEGLLTLRGNGNTTAAAETLLMADYVKDNYATAPIRIGQITIRPQTPTGTYGQATWDLMTGIDISDRVFVTTSHVGGGGFSNVGFYTEGIHYVIEPMGDASPECTLTLDVSPTSLYDSNPFE